MLALPSLLTIALLFAGVNGKDHVDPNHRQRAVREVNDNDPSDYNGPVGKAMPLTRRALPVKLPNGAVNMASLDQDIARTRRKLQSNVDIIKHRLGRNSTALQERDLQLGLDIQEAGIWTAPVQIGTPAKTFEMYLDTGSADFVVADGACPASSCSNKTRYSTSASSTSTTTGTSVSVTYLSGGSTTGKLIYDKVTIATSTAAQLGIVAATTMTSFLTSLPIDGMGLGWPALSRSKSPTFPFVIAGQSGFDRFTMRFSDTPGYSYFQMGTDRTRVPARYTPLDVVPTAGYASNTYWQVRDSQALVNGVRSLAVMSPMIFDCGTTNIIAPMADAKAFWAKVPGSKQYNSQIWTFPCANTVNVTFAFLRAKFPYPMDPENFNLGWLPEDPTRCVGAVLGLQTTMTQWLLGEAFLKQYASIYRISDVRPFVALAVPRDRPVR